MKRKVKIRSRKMFLDRLNKPLMCHINIEESGKKIFEFSGDMKEAFKRLKGIKEDVFQLEDGGDKYKSRNECEEK